MRILKGLRIAVIGLVGVAAAVYATRTNPLGPISGRELTGEVVTQPVTDWSFSDEYKTIAVETRRATPHSVTTICFTLDGALYVPAEKGSRKTWTQFAVADPRVRVKIGDKIYPVRATRILDDSLRSKLTQAARAKYHFKGDRSFDGVWVFRMESRFPDVGSGAARITHAVSSAANLAREFRALARRAPSRSSRPRSRDDDLRLPLHQAAQRPRLLGRGLGRA